MAKQNWQPQAIIFDMDGLLVESESIWHIAETELIESQGHVYTDEVRQQIIGMRLDEFMAKLHTIYNFDKTVERLTEDLINRMVALIPEQVIAQPGAAELIAYVQEQGFPRAVASSSPQIIIDTTLTAQGWDEVIPLRFTADNEAAGKPAPDVYLTAARHLNVAPENCLALEDSPNGARAAIAAGMTCYAVPDTTHSSPEAFAGITEHVFESLHDVLAALKAAKHA